MTKYDTGVKRAGKLGQYMTRAYGKHYYCGLSMRRCMYPHTISKVSIECAVLVAYPHLSAAQDDLLSYLVCYEDVMDASKSEGMAMQNN